MADLDVAGPFPPRAHDDADWSAARPQLGFSDADEFFRQPLVCRVSLDGNPSGVCFRTFRFNYNCTTDARAWEERLKRKGTRSEGSAVYSLSVFTLSEVRNQVLRYFRTTNHPCPHICPVLFHIGVQIVSTGLTGQVFVHVYCRPRASDWDVPWRPPRRRGPTTGGGPNHPEYTGTAWMTVEKLAGCRPGKTDTGSAVACGLYRPRSGWEDPFPSPGSEPARIPENEVREQARSQASSKEAAVESAARSACPKGPHCTLQPDPLRPSEEESYYDPSEGSAVVCSRYNWTCRGIAASTTEETAPRPGYQQLGTEGGAHGSDRSHSQVTPSRSERFLVVSAPHLSESVVLRHLLALSPQGRSVVWATSDENPGEGELDSSRVKRIEPSAWRVGAGSPGEGLLE